MLASVGFGLGLALAPDALGLVPVGLVLAPPGWFADGVGAALVAVVGCVVPEARVPLSPVFGLLGALGVLLGLGLVLGLGVVLGLGAVAGLGVLVGVGVVVGLAGAA